MQEPFPLEKAAVLRLEVGTEFCWEGKHFVSYLGLCPDDSSDLISFKALNRQVCSHRDPTKRRGRRLSRFLLIQISTMPLHRGWKLLSAHSRTELPLSMMIDYVCRIPAFSNHSPF